MVERYVWKKDRKPKLIGHKPWQPMPGVPFVTYDTKYDDDPKSPYYILPQLRRTQGPEFKKRAPWRG